MKQFDCRECKSFGIECDQRSCANENYKGNEGCFVSRNQIQERQEEISEAEQVRRDLEAKIRRLEELIRSGAGVIVETAVARVSKLI